MKKLIATTFIALFMFVYSQQSSIAQSNPREVPYLLVGLGLGINDNGLGIGVQLPFNANFSVYGDAGLGGWGYKLGGGLSYSIEQITKGSEISIGYAVASGLNDFDVELFVEPYGNKEDVNLNLKPAGTVNLKYTYNFRIGRYSKAGLSAGWAVPVTNNPWEVTDGSVLTSDSKQVLQIVQPGGIILGVKIMIGLGPQIR